MKNHSRGTEWLISDRDSAPNTQLHPSDDSSLAGERQQINIPIDRNVDIDIENANAVIYVGANLKEADPSGYPPIRCR